MVAGRTFTWDSRDRNGRILGWVMVDDGIWVNKVMVLTGYAWWFERYSLDEDQLRAAQEAKRMVAQKLIPAAKVCWANIMDTQPGNN